MFACHPSSKVDLTCILRGNPSTMLTPVKATWAVKCFSWPTLSENKKCIWSKNVLLRERELHFAEQGYLRFGKRYMNLHQQSYFAQGKHYIHLEKKLYVKEKQIHVSSKQKHQGNSLKLDNHFWYRKSIIEYRNIQMFSKMLSKKPDRCFISCLLSKSNIFMK